MQHPSKKYVGVHNDVNGGMTDTGKIIRDAWVFGIIPETETCEGWLAADIEDLWRKVDAEWEKHDFLISNLSDEIRERFYRTHNEAYLQAKAAGRDADTAPVGD